MANLYILSEQFRVLQEMIDDISSDEDFDKDDIQVYIDTLEGIQCSLELKIENIHKLSKNLESDIAGLKKEEARLAKHRGYLENKVKGLKKYVFDAMDNAKIKKVEGVYGARFHPNNPSVEIIDENLVPDKYKKTEVSVMKQELLNDLKVLKDGEVITGAKIAPTTYHLRWK